MAGYECEFVEKPPKAVQSECPICLLVLKEPYQATCCGKSFCKECIERIKTSNKACPTCNDGNFNLFHNKGLQQSLYDFQVYCTHKSKGCKWTGELRELNNHLNSDPPAEKSLEGCSFTVISCPLSHIGCKMKLFRKDIKVHVNDNLLDHIMKQTTLVQTLVQDNTILNKQLQSVKEEKQHLEQHMMELEREVKQLKVTYQVVSHTGQPIGPVEFTMTNFEQHKTDGDRWYSPPFYTNPHGYKMCLAVFANGYGRGEGTHIGVSTHVMRGEFDDQLKWPFQGNITIQLLDQEGDKGHVVKKINIHDNEYANRVTEGERNNVGIGLENFLPHTDLQPKHLKNDCIKLRIKKIVLN